MSFSTFLPSNLLYFSIQFFKLPSQISKFKVNKKPKNMNALHYLSTPFLEPHTPNKKSNPHESSPSTTIENNENHDKTKMLNPSKTLPQQNNLSQNPYTPLKSTPFLKLKKQITKFKQDPFTYIVNLNFKKLFLLILVIFIVTWCCWTLVIVTLINLVYGGNGLIQCLYMQTPEVSVFLFFF